MSLFEPFDEGAENEIMEQITETLDELRNLGFIEVVGIDEHGEWLYKATEAGIDFYNNQQEEK